MKRSYSTCELAKMWEVSESTIKRWADAGTLRCRKTIGGHRKFDKEDVLEFQAHSGLVAPGPSTAHSREEMDGEVAELISRQDFAALSNLYLSSAVAGEDRDITVLLNRLYLSGTSLVTIAEQIIRPAMWQIGEMWRTGRLQVYEEHLASFATLQALAELNRVLARKPAVNRLALVGCSEDEFHLLASVIVRCLLEAEGWRVISLGTHTPLFSFADAVSRFHPDLICISATMADNMERAARDYKGLYRAASKHGTRIVIGGAGFHEQEVRDRFEGASYAASLYELIDIVGEAGRE